MDRSRILWINSGGALRLLRVGVAGLCGSWSLFLVPRMGDAALSLLSKLRALSFTLTDGLASPDSMVRAATRDGVHLCFHRRMKTKRLRACSPKTLSFSKRCGKAVYTTKIQDAVDPRFAHFHLRSKIRFELYGPP